MGSWFYRLDGNRSLQREAAPVSRTGKVGALQNQASGAHNAPNLGKGLGQAPQGASGSRFFASQRFAQHQLSVRPLRDLLEAGLLVQAHRAGVVPLVARLAHLGIRLDRGIALGGGVRDCAGE